MQQHAGVKQFSVFLFSPKSDKQADKSLGRGTEAAGKISNPRNTDKPNGIAQTKNATLRTRKTRPHGNKGDECLAYVKKRVGQQQDRHRQDIRRGTSKNRENTERTRLSE